MTLTELAQSTLPTASGASLSSRGKLGGGRPPSRIALRILTLLELPLIEPVKATTP